MFISGCVFDWFNWFRDIPKNIGESLIQCLQFVQCMVYYTYKTIQRKVRTMEDIKMTEDKEFCLQPPVRVMEEYEESIEIELDSIGELETSEDLDFSDWEEVESDDGHRELYE